MIGSEDTRDLIDTCVHCGFCLPACPTYQLWGEEMDSPRGRIHLMSLLEEGEIEMEAAAPHIDRCLGCLACVTACPSGVRYDTLIERTRVRRREEAPTGLRDAAARPRRVRAVPAPAAAARGVLAAGAGHPAEPAGAAGQLRRHARRARSG